MELAKFNQEVDKFLLSGQDRKRLLPLRNYDNIIYLVQQLEGEYLTAEQVVRNGHPTHKTSNKKFYVIKDYDINSDSLFLWLGKIK